MTGFRHRISDALDNPSGTVLFDQLTTSIIREDDSLREKFSPVGKSRSRRAATGTGLVEWLPVFPDAPMSSVLEAREELADGRAKYRASVKALSAELQSSALDETLPSDIEELWRDEVRPTLIDIRKTVKGSRIAKETGLRLATEGYGYSDHHSHSHQPEQRCRPPPHFSRSDGGFIADCSFWGEGSS